MTLDYNKYASDEALNIHFWTMDCVYFNCQLCNQTDGNGQTIGYAFYVDSMKVATYRKPLTIDATREKCYKLVRDKLQSLIPEIGK